MSKPVLVLQNDPDVPPGILGEWMSTRGLECDVLLVREAAPDRPLNQYAAIATLGSSASVNDSFDWILREAEILKQAISGGIPVLGLCFGGQILAQAAGGSVRRAAQTEIGLVTLDSDEPHLVPSGPWFAWHHDTFVPPPGAEVLARTDVCPHAFALGPHLGLQFHPEATADIVATWVQGYAAEVETAGLSPDALLTDLRDREEEARTLAFSLFDAFWTRAHR